MMDRETIMARIRALRQMTVGRGCTEAEAMAAAEKAAQLMRSIGVSEAEVEMEQAEFRPRHGVRSHITRLWLIIARCTNCAVLHDKDEAALVFYGEGAGPEIATYLSDICRRAMKTAERGYMASGAYQRLRKSSTRRSALEGFRTGMAMRLAMRIREMFEDSISEEARTRAVAARDAASGGGASVAIRDRKIRNTAAVGAGVMAGDAVPLNHGVRTDGPALQIGGQ